MAMRLNTIFTASLQLNAQQFIFTFISIAKDKIQGLYREFVLVIEAYITKGIDFTDRVLYRQTQITHPRLSCKIELTGRFISLMVRGI